SRRRARPPPAGRLAGRAGAAASARLPSSTPPLEDRFRLGPETREDGILRRVRLGPRDPPAEIGPRRLLPPESERFHREEEEVLRLAPVGRERLQLRLERLARRAVPVERDAERAQVLL